MSLLGRKPSGPVSDEAKQAQLADRRQKAALRSARMAQTREARKACGAMKAPEASRGLYAALALLAIAVFSFLSKDVAQETKTVNHKSIIENVPYGPHPAGALLLGVLALATIGTIYFRRRLVTVIAFMVTAAIGVDVPLPLADTDLRWVAFLVPAAYALWIYAFRLRKDQTAWMAEHPLPGSLATGSGGAARAGAARGGTPARGARKAPAGTARSRGAKQEPVLGPNGRALPSNTGRYTQPKPKPKAAQKPSA